ncbi:MULTISPECIES: hypothetical protein [unclassified Sphingopyxis]|uniref:hypothetical protein n=1 Tax=unclassified Sphingopyxis TaxID=2614943 RepID=UPI00073605D9|nr:MULTISPECIES: hypothetical protein [unclassified Sphingopyxis]KTE39769.1 hypothetical protein ATE62_08555 [Sphingopyxis sp. HIX]KTE84872.1 hypothetical protein ATE72_06800 [Sphingopyxis sp. HXXIV]
MIKAGEILWNVKAKEIAELGTLPVRVRTRDGILVASGFSGQQFEVPLGDYVVSVLMPDGTEVPSQKLTHVKEGKIVAPRIDLDSLRGVSANIAVQISSPAETAFFDTTASADSYLVAEALPESIAVPPPTAAASPVGAEPAAAEADPAPAAPETGQVAAGLWRGSLLEAWDGPQTIFDGNFLDPAMTLSEGQPVEIVTQAGEDQCLVLRHQAVNEAGDSRPMLRLCVVPFDRAAGQDPDNAARGSILALLRRDQGIAAVRYRSPFCSEANALLDFVDSGIYGGMQTVSAAFIERGPGLLDEPGFSLLRGMTGVYVMLRTNAVDALEQWIDALAERAPQVADIRAMRVEFLARTGRHAEAAAALSRALDAECPWCRAGVSYLVERLRLYLDLEGASRKSLGVGADDWERFGAAKKRFERLTPFLSTGHVFTTFDVPIGQK